MWEALRVANRSFLWLRYEARYNRYAQIKPKGKNVPTDVDALQNSEMQFDGSKHDRRAMGKNSFKRTIFSQALFFVIVFSRASSVEKLRIKLKPFWTPSMKSWSGLAYIRSPGIRETISSNEGSTSIPKSTETSNGLHARAIDQAGQRIHRIWAWWENLWRAKQSSFSHRSSAGSRYSDSYKWLCRSFWIDASLIGHVIRSIAVRTIFG